ncbi:MAG: metallophosphoesterase [Verrucomicrobiales bacterium]|jgi:Icc-related predicted phosphoesterase|nr:metallophosphoesterase [Verrucomicrobiales bacterium]
MKILVVSDIHYSLPQYDWLTRESTAHDLVIIAGDLMEMGSDVDLDTQASVVSQYFRRISAAVPLVVCSGNHDLVEDYEGVRSAEWLEDLSIPNLTVDHGSYETPELRILSFPWWESDEEHERIKRWLEMQARPDDPRPVFWVHHAPPLGAKTSWNGKRDLGDKSLVGWIKRYQPDVVFSGHVHNAPYYGPEGSWIDRIGDTVVINGGRQIGAKPATVELELEDGQLVWCSMEGCEEKRLSAV